MKNFRQILSLLLAAFLLLAGCGKPPVSETAPTTVGEETAPSGSGQVSSIEPTADPDNSQDFAIVYYDKCDYDFYFDVIGSFTYPIYILSREPIDVSTITATVSGGIPASFLAVNGDETMAWETAAGVSNIDFHDYIYQCYRGMDWKEAAQLYIADQEAANHYREVQTQDAFDASAAASESFIRYIDRYIDDYNTIKEPYMKNGPYFHAYPVYIYFEMPTGDQTAEQVELSVGDQTYTLDIGQIRLHETLPEGLHGIRRNGISNCALGSDTFLTPWNDGYVQVIFDFLADTDLKLNRLYALNGEKTRVQKIRIQRTTDTGMDFDTEWDGSSPVEIDPGERVQFRIDASVPDMAGQSIYYDTQYFVLEYEADGQASAFFFFNSLATTDNFYELGAIYLDGIDIKSYYTDYYNVMQAYFRGD